MKSKLLILGPIVLNLEETEKVAIACIATGARPAPQFKWYIGDQLYNQNINTSIENLQDDRATYTSTFNYNGNPKDIAQMLKCEVIHKGYPNQQLSDEDNLEEAQLNLSFKPDPDAKITCYQMEGSVDYKEISCYKMKNGKSSMVKIMFLANPKPTEGEWHVIGKSPIPTNSSIDDFSSSPISDGDLEGEYQVTLDFIMTPEIVAGNNFFKVTNNFGITEIKFDFEITSSTTTSSTTSSTIISTTSSTSSSTSSSTAISTTNISPKCHETTFKGMQDNQFSTVKTMLVANPEPTVIWHIDFGDNFDNSEISSSEINNGPDENSYFVESSFIMTEDLNRKNGSIEIVNSNGNTFCNFTLALQYPPKDDPKIIIDLDSGFVEITFFANPEPTNGSWTIGNEKVPIGQKENPDTIFMSGSLISSGISEGPLKDEYIARLQFTNKPELAKQKCTFEVSNSVGTTKYPIDFHPRFKPKMKSMYVGLTDEESFVKVTFEAYPKPFSGHWNVHNTIVPIGETNVEKKLITFEISDGLNENEYVAILNFFMDSTFVANETFNLVIKNEMGSAIIPIDIKPQFKPEINENWSETNKGNSCTIEISMRANPKPTNGNWLIDDIIVPIGESSKNGAFQSSKVIDSYGEDAYAIILTFDCDLNMTGKIIQLEVENLKGRTEYNLELAEEPNGGATMDKKVKKSGAAPIFISIIIGIGISFLFLILIAICWRWHLQHNK